MKPQKICQIIPCVHEGYLIISLEQKWIEVCKGIPFFTVVINETGRLVLEGPVIEKNKPKGVWK